MKKRLITIIIAILAIITISVSAYAETLTEKLSDVDTTAESEFDISKIGDANGDGKISASDARLILRISAKLERAPDEWTHLDITADGKITASDARILLRISAKLDSVENYSECFVNGHNFTEHTIAPTCTENGYTTQKCSRCNYATDEKTNVINATGHDYSFNTITTNATCTESGYKKMFCHCGASVEYISESAKGHNMQVSKIMKATCVSDGYTEYKCSVCDVIEKSIIKATGHKYEYVSKNFYETTNFVGYKSTKKCTYCNKIIETYDYRNGNSQIETKLLESAEAKAIIKKFNLGTGYPIEGYDITGTKVVVYNEIKGIDFNGYYYNIDGTQKENCSRCHKPAGIGENMCNLFCGLSVSPV